MLLFFAFYLKPIQYTIYPIALQTGNKYAVLPPQNRALKVRVPCAMLFMMGKADGSARFFRFLALPAGTGMCGAPGTGAFLYRKAGGMNKTGNRGGLVRGDLARGAKKRLPGASKTGNTETEARIGRQMISALMQEEGVSYERAAELLIGGAMPTGAEAFSAAAAEELTALARDGALSEEQVEEYLADEDFIALLCRMPAEAAVELYQTRIERGELEQNVRSARENGQRDVLERIRAQKALPSSMRTSTPANPEIDFYTMSDEDFARYKERRLREQRG